MNPTSPAGAPALIAIIDDEECVRTALGSLLRSIDVPSQLFDCGVSFLEQDLDRFALVLSDIQMPGLSGFELIERIHAKAPGLPVALMTAFPDPAWRRRAEELGAYRFLSKPLDADEVIDIVERLVPGHDVRNASE